MIKSTGLFGDLSIFQVNVLLSVVLREVKSKGFAVQVSVFSVNCMMLHCWQLRYKVYGLYVSHFTFNLIYFSFLAYT